MNSRHKEPSSFSSILITGGMCLLLIAGCNSRKPTERPFNSGRNPHIEFKHGSKIIVHHSKEQNKTFFTQRDIKINPEITIGSQKVVGTHAFEIDITATSDGNDLPIKVTLTLLYDTPSKSGSHYPATTKFAAVADGQRLDYLCHRRTTERLLEKSADDSPKSLQSDALTKDDPSDPDFYEALFMDIPLQAFITIANAKFVQIDIGSASFFLPAETVLAFHDLAEVMSKK